MQPIYNVPQYVERVETMLSQLEEILARAQRCFINRNDSRNYVSLEDFATLAINGAKIESLNRNHSGGNYIHELSWGDFYWFITVTTDQIEIRIPDCLYM